MEQKQNHKATYFNWEPSTSRLTENSSKDKTNVKVWTVDSDGKTNAFTNLEEMKYHSI